jgi:aminopeptidase N
MARYTTRIEADKAKYPVLLSNGNLKEAGELEGGRHFAVWEVRGAKGGKEGVGSMRLWHAVLRGAV